MGPSPFARGLADSSGRAGTMPEGSLPGCLLELNFTAEQRSWRLGASGRPEHHVLLMVSPAVALPVLAAVTQAARQPVLLPQEAHKKHLSIWTETLFALKAQPMFLSIVLRTGTSQVKLLVWWKQRDLGETFYLLVTHGWQQDTREKYVCVFSALKLLLCYSRQRKKFSGERNSD